MDTSKTGTLKSLLLQAWRERWTDLQWGINVKQVLTRGVSGDVYNLAEHILQQALVGPAPNFLTFAYLKHSLSSQIISYGATINSIGRYQELHKIQCVISLIDLLKAIHRRVSCHGNAEDCVTLCSAMVQCTLWLFQIIHHCLLKLIELKISPEHSTMIEKSCEVLKLYMDSPFIRALLYIGQYENEVVYSQLLGKIKDVEVCLGQLPLPLTPLKDTVEATVTTFNNLEVVGQSFLKQPPYLQLPKRTYTGINGLVILEATLKPVNSVQAFADQLVLLKKMRCIPWFHLYEELIRACCMGLIDVSGSPDELKWASFTFLKMPQVILRIYTMHKEVTSLAEAGQELEDGMNLLLNYVPMLDLTDMKCTCDSFQYILTEFNKIGLLTEDQVKKLSLRRQSETNKPATAQGASLGKGEQKAQPGNPELIMRAEPTVGSILKTLDVDYSKNQDALLGVLCHMMTGKSFELILSAAVGKSNLQAFVTKLIKSNEFSKHSSAELSIKATQTRALLFDITFLMLCHIAQHYGTDFILSMEETKDSFFTQWISECMSENGKFKSPDILLQRADASKVDQLLAQFTSSDSELKTSQVKWYDVCINSPAAIKEVLIAWEHGSINTETVKGILDTVKSRMCCIPVCISAWLCNYINLVHHDNRLKPMSMLQEFQKPIVVETPGDMNLNSTQQEHLPNYKERSSLMISIIKRMLYEIHPPSTVSAKGTKQPIISRGLVSKQPIQEIMQSTFDAMHTKGWLDIKTTHVFENLLYAGGPQWFVRALIEETLKFVYDSVLDQAIDLVFAIFHVNLEQCTLVLLGHTLPMYLQNPSKHDSLVEPMGAALARLTVMCVFAVMQMKQTVQREAGSSSVRKKGILQLRREMELEEIYEGFNSEWLAKYRKWGGDCEIFDDNLSSLSYVSTDDGSDLIRRALADLFCLLTVIVNDSMVNQRMHFVVLLLQQIVRCGRERVKSMHPFIPLSLVTRLIKIMPDVFTTDFVLALSDMTSSGGRKATAKVICQLKNYRPPTL